MEHESLKKEIILKLSIATELEELKTNSIILITSIGIITGNINDSDKDESDVSSFLLGKLVSNSIVSYKEKHNLGDSPLKGNDGVIVLKDAIITNNGLDAHFKELAVFYDQIIGITIGELPK